jgi:CheY-like chemotaxis protein
MNHKQLMIVEGDPITQADYLESLEHVDVYFVTSVSRAQALMSIMEPDLIFLDLDLPDGDFFAVINALDKTYPALQIPVVVVSESINAKRDEELIQAGAAAIITKPLKTQQIRDAVLRYA